MQMDLAEAVQCVEISGIVFQQRGVVLHGLAEFAALMGTPRAAAQQPARVCFDVLRGAAHSLTSGNQRW